jgi:hypothetical protein
LKRSRIAAHQPKIDDYEFPPFAEATRQTTQNLNQVAEEIEYEFFQR